MKQHRDRVNKAVAEVSDDFDRSYKKLAALLKQGARKLIGAIECVWDGVKWVAVSIGLVVFDVVQAVWEGTKWIASAAYKGIVKGAEIVWDGVKWVAVTAVAAIRVGAVMIKAGVEAIWDGVKW